MTSDAVMVIQCVFSNIWWLFTSWTIPGTDSITPMMAMIFVVLSSLGLRYFLRILGTTGVGVPQATKSASRISRHGE